MNTFKGTPGPWKFEQYRSIIQQGAIFNDKNSKVADIPRIIQGGCPESEANGKLIAASKQMMEALQELVSAADLALGSTTYDEPWLFKAKAALSAALD